MLSHGEHSWGRVAKRNGLAQEMLPPHRSGIPFNDGDLESEQRIRVTAARLEDRSAMRGMVRRKADWVGRLGDEHEREIMAGTSL